MAPDDLRGNRGLHVGEIEHTGLGGELRMEDDLQPEVAQLARELGRGTGLERVVDLVRLLEEMLAQRSVGLLAIPRAAVGRAQPLRDPGHRPRTHHRELGGDRRDVDGGLERRRVERADGHAVRLAEATDRVVGGVQATQDVDRVVAPGTCPAGERSGGDDLVTGPEQRKRHDQKRA
jgi:hypothetical protein